MGDLICQQTLSHCPLFQLWSAKVEKITGTWKEVGKDKENLIKWQNWEVQPRLVN